MSVIRRGNRAVVADALDESRDINERIATLEREVKRIKAIQSRNLPEFREALKRISTMRETIHNHSNALMRIEKIATDSAASGAATATSIAELVAVLKGAKTATGILRRYWPRIATALLGIAIGKGWLTVEDGKSLTSIFGM